MTAVVAGALTAGVAAANVPAAPEKVEAADVDLAASITIPIIDIDTPGPISISRLLSLTLEALPNSLKAILDEEIASQVRRIAESEVRRMQGPQEPFAGMRRYFAAQWGLPGPE